MNLAKIKAAVAGLSYLAIVSLAAYNLRGQLFGTSIPSASASSTPIAALPQAATAEPAAPSTSNSSVQSDLKTLEPATRPPAGNEKQNPAGWLVPSEKKASAPTRTQQSLIPVAGNGLVTVGNRLPNFLFMGLNGNTMTESTLHGHKTLFIIVSPTCPHCQKELRLLHEIENDYPSIEPVFASMFPLDQTRPLADMTGEGDHIYTGARELAQDLGVTAVPFLMLIDEKGIVRAIRKGELQEPDFRDMLGRFARGEAVPQVSQATPPSVRRVRGEQA